MTGSAIQLQRDLCVRNGESRRVGRWASDRAIERVPVTEIPGEDQLRARRRGWHASIVRSGPEDVELVIDGKDVDLSVGMPAVRYSPNEVQTIAIVESVVNKLGGRSISREGQASAVTFFL